MSENDLNLKHTLFYSSIPFLVIGLTGNLLVIRIVHKTREMHTPTNYLLASMALSDVITILVWSFYFFEFKQTTFTCKLLVIVEVLKMVSSITLTVLAAERYHAVLKPLRAGLRLNEDNIEKAVAYIWIASVVICFPEFFLKEGSEP